MISSPSSVLPKQNEPEASYDVAAKVARLTEKERDCLRRWLNHQTAKQIALELNISHHAVEKRLKTARAKLDVTTSIEAAKMLQQAEEYKQTASKAPDLPKPTSNDHKKNSFSVTKGVFVMIVTLVVAASIVAQPGIRVDGDLNAQPSASEDLGALRFGQSASADPSEPKTIILSSKKIEFKPATVAELREWLGMIFRTTDKDESGFIELSEAPRSFVMEEAMGEMIFTGASAQAAFIEEHDQDADGMISEAEFIDTSIDAFKDTGIPLLPDAMRLTGKEHGETTP
ncbi:LuxR C-terminal-related transcriptional regulator [Erythrobacter sp. HA6-11]